MNSKIKRLITYDDFAETYAKIHQRGLQFIFSKFNLNQSKRTRSAFNAEFDSSNYWIIPGVRKRWNRIISGDESKSYEHYVVESYLKNKTGLKFLSLGSGVCSHELIFASYPQFSEVKCVDFSEKLLQTADSIAKGKGLTNMVFSSENVNEMSLPENSLDVVLFHSSLHHFENVEELLIKINQALKPNGILVLNDFMGPHRLQYPKQQIQAINYILKYHIPKKFRERYLTGIIKEFITGPGYLRMYLADPSEAIESEKIIPALRNHFKTLEEKNVGGDLLMLLLKDISHHFTNENEETRRVLDIIFKEEEKFISNRVGDFVFGIYEKKE